MAYDHIYHPFLNGFAWCSSKRYTDIGITIENVKARHMPDEVFINPFNKQMTNQEQLLYNWQRGKYSIVRSKERFIGVVSTKHTEDGAAMRFTGWYKDREEAYRFIGNCIMGEEFFNKFSDIDHIERAVEPECFMGSGFDVGDRVAIYDNGYERLGTIVERENSARCDDALPYRVARDDRKEIGCSHPEACDCCQWVHAGQIRPLPPVTTNVPKRKKRQFKHLFTARCVGGINLGDHCTIRQDDKGQFAAYTTNSSNEFRFSDRIGQSMAIFTDGELVDYVYESHPVMDTNTYYLMPVDLRQKEEGVKATNEDDCYCDE